METLELVTNDYWLAEDGIIIDILFVCRVV